MSLKYEPASEQVLRTSVMTHEQTLESFRKEIDILAMLDHPHVLKLYAAVCPNQKCEAVPRRARI